MPVTTNDSYSDMPPAIKTHLQRIDWRVNKIEEELNDEIKSLEEKLSDEIATRKENDNLLFSKFDHMNNMIIYQLCAAILTLVAVVAILITK